MNPKKEGWFKKYIEFRENSPLGLQLPSSGIRIFEDVGVHNEIDQAIYYFLQPTGLFYGIPEVFPFADVEYPRSQYYDRDDRSLVTMLDSVMACLVADRHFLLAGLSDESDHFSPAVNQLQEYYLLRPREWRAKRFRPFGSLRLLRLRPYRHRRFEREFQHRLTVKPPFLRIRDPFANIFLFLDLYHCLIWQRRRLMDGAETRELSSQYQEQLVQRETLLKLIIATVYVDREIDRDDRRLVKRFFLASRLPERRLAALNKLLTRGLDLHEIEIPTMPWLIRRYFLEQVLMITMLDRTITQDEEALLSRLVERLGLWREELDQSRAALAGFLVTHVDRLRFQAQPPNLFSLGEQLAEKAAIAIRLNLDRVVNEIRETQELYTLLMKSAKEPLTEEEKKKVQDQLMDILKTIPALAIFALPGGGIILPIVIKLLPFNLLPSSFEN